MNYLSSDSGSNLDNWWLSMEIENNDGGMENSRLAIENTWRYLLEILKSRSALCMHIIVKRFA